MKYTFLILILFTGACSVERPVRTAGNERTAPLLFTVEEDSIFADEFIYVYEKNNQSNDSAFTPVDVRNYLELYENFKLKVHEARQRGMDTTTAYLNEMKAYEAQLKSPYLTETKVTDQLVREAYDRFSEEIRASHILIRLPADAAPADTLAAYEKITGVREQALAGASFDSLAVQYSQDPSARNNGGDLQYFTSFQMVYPFETAAYTTPVDSISPVIRTDFGYHIIKVTDRRPSTYKVSVSHIMIRHKPADSLAARNRIFEIYDQAAGGVDWDQLVASYSEDQNSSRIGGRLQAFGLRQMPFSFQEAAFALSEGNISDPVRTDFGWHIIRLESRIPLPEYKDMENTIRNRVGQDVRAEIGNQALIDRLTTEWGAKMIVSPESPVDPGDTLALFIIGDSTYTTPGYTQFLEERGLQTGEDPDNLVGEYMEASLIAYEEAHLEEKYTDYRMLLREYREGILLFQLMDEEIWSRASEDTTGIRAYYNTNRAKYRRPAHIRGTLYSIRDSDLRDSLFTAVLSNAEGSLEDLIAQYERENVVIPSSVEGSPEELGIREDTAIRAGQILPAKNGILKIYELTGSGIPELKDIRGTVIADYQNFLEKEWIGQLRAKYNVSVNEDGLKYVIQNLVR